jgi:uncharacterized protein (TIGR01777 family)
MKTDKIIIAGGTGFLGQCLIRNYYGSDTKVIVLSRSHRADDKNISYVQWDAKSFGEWTNELEGSTALINLVGKSVNCRYTKDNRKEIFESRVDSTKILGLAIKECKNPPKVWINAGSAAIFGNSGDEIKKEGSQIGTGFSVEVCKAWEKTFNDCVTPSTRKVFLRIGMVLQPGKGVLKPFMNMVKMGFGGGIASGKQYMTWIHERDFIDMIEWAMSNEVRGIIHCASPNPVTNKEFLNSIRTVMNFPFGFPVPSFIIKIGAVLIGTAPELVLTGRRVVSEVLIKNGYEFKYPYLKDALSNLIVKN